MKKYEQIKAKYREKAFPIIDEWTFDEAVNEILEENAYLRRTVLHCLERIFRYRYCVSILCGSIVEKCDTKRLGKKSDKYFDMWKKAEQKWRDKKFVKNLKVQITL